MALYRSRLRVLQLATFATLAYASSVSAGPVGGAVQAINSLTNQVDVTSLNIGDTYANGGAKSGTDVTIVTAQIDNNFDKGWKLTVASANSGKLLLSGSGGGAGREVLYTNVKLVKTAGTLGTDLADPSGTSVDVTGGSGMFNTRTNQGALNTATTATVGYQFALKISWSADTSLLRGDYRDTITLTLADDAL